MFLFLPLWLICLRSNLLTPSVALVLIYTLAVLPVCIWQLHGSLNRLPPELEEAARIDGCSAGQFFRQVVLPSIAPNLVVTVVSSLIAAWSLGVITPSILQIPGSPVLLQQTNGFDSAAVGIALVPLVALFLILSVYLVRNARTSSQVSTP
jgi:multiple sugar transport system permease protein